MAYQFRQATRQTRTPERVVVKGQLTVYCGEPGYEVYGTSHSGKNRTFIFPTLDAFKEALYDRFVANPPAEDGWATRFNRNNVMESAVHGTIARVNKDGKELAPWKLVLTSGACIGIAAGYDNRPLVKKIDDAGLLDTEDDEEEEVEDDII